MVFGGVLWNSIIFVYVVQYHCTFTINMLNIIWRKYWNVLNNKIKRCGGGGSRCAVAAHFTAIINGLFDNGKRKNENIFIVDNNNVKFDEFGAVPAQHHNV